MKINKLITAALVSLGLVSAAYASSSVTISGTTYTVVYISGSTAFRPNVFVSVNGNTGSFATNSGSTTLGTSVFDAQPTYQAATLPPTGSTSVYNAYGTINGVPYLLSFNFTGSEAGIAALENNTITYPIGSNITPRPGSNATLPGTPTVLFIDPNNSPNNIATPVTPDLAFADTSSAVSLSSASGVTECGIVGVIPFEWVKGKFTSPDTAWQDVTNVTTPNALVMLGTGKQHASYVTGNTNDTDYVYLIGRNKGSGTRVNTVLETYYGTTTSVKQYCPGNSTYTPSGSLGVLTVGTIGALSSSGGLVSIANEGFDAGSGVAKTLEYDCNGYTLNSLGVITLGYLGISDAGTAIGGGGGKLTLDGVAESDATIIEGQYPFWGHEHLYGLSTQTSSTAGGFIADVFTGLYTKNGGTPNGGLHTLSTASGALEFSSFGTGGGHESVANWATTQSTALDTALVNCDKSGDSGYPTQQ